MSLNVFASTDRVPELLDGAVALATFILASVTVWLAASTRRMAGESYKTRIDSTSHRVSIVGGVVQRETYGRPDHGGASHKLIPVGTLFDLIPQEFEAITIRFTVFIRNEGQTSARLTVERPTGVTLHQLLNQSQEGVSYPMVDLDPYMTLDPGVRYGLEVNICKSLRQWVEEVSTSIPIPIQVVLEVTDFGQRGATDQWVVEVFAPVVGIVQDRDDDGYRWKVIDRDPGGYTVGGWQSPFWFKVLSNERSYPVDAEKQNLWNPTWLSRFLIPDNMKSRKE